MAYDVTTTPSVDDATKLADYTRLRDAARALAGAMGGVVLAQGGSLDEFLSDTTEVDLPNGPGAAGWPVDGTHLGYVTVELQVVAIRHPDAAGTVTCTVDLYNVTDAGAVASSAVAVSLTTTAATAGASSALTLPTSVKRFKARIKTSDGTRLVAAVWRLVAKGS